MQQIDLLAKEESRSRSEIIREAARLYIDRKNRWKNLFAFGEKLQKEIAVSDEEIISEIRKVRKPVP